MTLVPSELLDYYAGLLIVQYKNKDKAKKTIRLLANQSVCDSLLPSLLECFNLDTALGSQLDILGKIVGVPRNIFGLDLVNVYFNLDDYTESGSEGFGLYTDTPYEEDLWLRYRTDAVYTLEDFEMRNLIKIKIIQNTQYPSLENLVIAFNDLFGSDVLIIDRLDMTATYQVSAFYKPIFTVAQFLDIIPKPMGVGVDVSTSSYSSSSTSSSSTSSSSRSSSSSSVSSSSSSTSSSSTSSSSSSTSTVPNILYFHATCNDDAANTTVTDSGTGSNNGTASVNTSILSTTGVVSKAFEFVQASSQYINLDNLAADIKTDSVGSLCLWVYPTINSNGDLFSISSSTSNFFFRLRRSVSSPGDRLQIELYNGAYQIQAYEAVLTINTWTHIALVQDGISLKIYVNGALATFDFSEGVDNSAWLADLSDVDNARLGCLNKNGEGNASFLDGLLDDVRYYREAISADLIEDIYNYGRGSEDTTPSASSSSSSA